MDTKGVAEHLAPTLDPLINKSAAAVVETFGEIFRLDLTTRFNCMKRKYIF